MSGDSEKGGLDVSRSAVSARLAAFIREHREAKAAGDPRAFRECDRLLCAWAEDALRQQEAAERFEAEAQVAEAELERQMLAQRGGRVQ